MKKSRARLWWCGFDAVEPSGSRREVGRASVETAAAHHWRSQQGTQQQQQRAGIRTTSSDADQPWERDAVASTPRSVVIASTNVVVYSVTYRRKHRSTEVEFSSVAVVLFSYFMLFIYLTNENLVNQTFTVTFWTMIFHLLKILAFCNLMNNDVTAPYDSTKNTPLCNASGVCGARKILYIHI